MKFIILVGGFGTRLRHLVADRPKSMADISGKFFLHYLLKYLERFKPEKVVLSSHYMSEKIEEFITFHSFNYDFPINMVTEPEPLDTAGAILHSIKQMRFSNDEDICVLNGDSLFAIDYNKFFKFYKSSGSCLTLALKTVDDISRYGSIKINEDNLVKEIVEKGKSGNGFINGGIYVMKPRIFRELNLYDQKKMSFERELLPLAIKKLDVRGYVANDYFIDIGVEEDYKRAQSEIPAILNSTRDNGKNKALFLDRDGVINFDRGYIYKKSDFVFIDGIFELCKIAQNAGFLIIIVTNQAGIAHGYYTEEDFQSLTKYMVEEFSKNGVKISKVYHSPYHPNYPEKYKELAHHRKPNPGMILDAIKEFDIDPTKSILVGDKESDIQAGKNAGLKWNIMIDDGGHNRVIELFRNGGIESGK